MNERHKIKTGYTYTISDYGEEKKVTTLGSSDGGLTWQVKDDQGVISNVSSHELSPAPTPDSQPIVP